MSNLFKEIGRGYARGMFVWIAAVAIVLPLTCLFICFPLWLVTRQDVSIWVLILSSGIFLALLFGSIPVILLGAYSSRKRKLDAIFVPLGMQGEAYQLLFRQYYGQIKGHQVGVYFYRGPILEIVVDTALQTRLTASQSRPHAAVDFLAEKPLVLNDPALVNLQVYTVDEGWARRLLQQPDVPQLLLRLTAPQENFVYRHVVLRPGKLILMSAFNPRLFCFDLDPQETQSWVGDMLFLADRLHLVEPPAKKLEKSAMEELLDKRRSPKRS